MSWHSLDTFLAMGGYALYVWGSFGVTAAALLMEPWLLRRRRNHILRILRRTIRANQANQPSGSSSPT